MGYRLEIKAGDKRFYGTKIFGYFDNEELRSYWVLRAYKKVTEDTYWRDCFENKIILNECEFNIFIDAYISDLEASDREGLEFDVEETIEELRAFKKIAGAKEISWG